MWLWVLRDLVVDSESSPTSRGLAERGRFPSRNRTKSFTITIMVSSSNVKTAGGSLQGRKPDEL